MEKTFKMGSAAYGAYKYETASPIVSFVTLGPKNYSILCENGEEIVKVRGFCLRNKYALTKINHAEMKRLLSAWLMGNEEEIHCDSFTMRLDRHRQSVQNRVMTKKYKNNGFDKRYLHPECQEDTVRTIAFGTQNGDFDDARPV